MSIKLMISQLRLGKTGADILQILDAITDNSIESVMETVETVGNTICQTDSFTNPTLEPIDF
jgi:hypothetical protein